jgi:HAD superfamily hydrolase (TIGR01662 family)
MAAGLARRPGLALVAAAGWLAGTAELASARIAPGPRNAAELRRMLLTSVAIPPAATWHSVRGALRHRRAQPWRGLPDLVLFDRDGTLVEDVPYNTRPELVRPVTGARDALDALRSEGVRVGVVSNQSGIGSGRITLAELDAVNTRVEELLGPFDTWAVCPHGRDAGCGCRKPRPGLVQRACAGLQVEPRRCVVVGDIGSDVEAAEAAGAAGILVPTAETLPGEVAAAGQVCESLSAAAAQILRGEW